MLRPTYVRRLPILFVLCGLVSLAGCGGLKTYPVRGKAMLGEQPLAGFALVFLPDPEQRLDCAARVDKEGRYSIRTDDGKQQFQGAPLGKYKVVIYSPDDKPIPVHKKYTQYHETDMTIEVVENPEPGRYDLKFVK